MTYHSGSAFEPTTFAHLLPESTAVVHTMGILLESDYKGVVREGSLLGMAGRLVGMGGLGENPLKKGGSHSAVGSSGGAGKGGYERINRDSGEQVGLDLVQGRRLTRCADCSSTSGVALSVLRTLLASKGPAPTSAVAPSPKTPTPFVYISAEDIFRPFIPSGYIASKRQAEQGIQELLTARDESQREITPLIVRPGQSLHADERAHSLLLRSAFDWLTTFRLDL